MEGEITDEMATQWGAMLLYWRMENPKLPGRIEIDSPGGSVTATLAFLDIMASVGFPVHTHCPSYASGCAVLVLARGTKGFRSVGPDVTIGMCPTTGAAANSTANPEQVAHFLVELRNRILDEFCAATNRTREEIAALQEQECVFTAQGALAYGLVDRVC